MCFNEIEGNKKYELLYFIAFTVISSKLGLKMHLRVCRLCSEPAATIIRYSGLPLCKKHFVEYLEKRVFKTVKKYKMIREGEKILLGVSGGKDSVVLLHILASFQNELRFEIIPLFIDLGIQPKKYSQLSGEIAKKNCEKLGLNLITVKIKEEYGFSLDDVFYKKLKRPICSVCGLIKRYILNKKAIELSADKVATGHNLNDEASFILQNFINMDIDLLSRLSPIQPTFNKLLIGRIKPLFEVYEDEVALYALFRKLEYIDITCPYAKEASILRLKNVLTELENIRPGATLTMVRGFHKKLKPLLQNKQKIEEEKSLNLCKLCEMPTSTEICSFCRLKSKIARR